MINSRYCIALQITSRKLGCFVAAGCLFVPVIFVALLKPELGLCSILDLELQRTIVRLPAFETDTRDGHLPADHDRDRDKDATIHDSELICDDSGDRTDVFEIKGDIRIHGASSTIFVASPQPRMQKKENSRKIRPYPRKWDSAAMAHVSELSINSTSMNELPKCSSTHQAPAIVFSTGGFTGNIYHDFNNILIPLFLTSREFHGEVQFVVSDFKYWWIYHRYKSIIDRLSHYEVVELGKENTVHCFRRALVGLRSHKTLGIESSKSPNNYSIMEFRGFLRTTYSLQREYATTSPKNQPGKKLRLLFLSRKGSRSITNEEEMVAMARSLGHEVVIAGPEVTMKLQSFASIVNSCDVMLGVSGAGLTNMVFLPANATLIYILPLGLKHIGTGDYGSPGREMGLRTLAYEVSMEESSLPEKYPRDHEVFKDPGLFQEKHGWNAFYEIFLLGQNVTLDLRRFKRVLLEALQPPAS